MEQLLFARTKSKNCLLTPFLILNLLHTYRGPSECTIRSRNSSYGGQNIQVQKQEIQPQVKLRNEELFSGKNSSVSGFALGLQPTSRKFLMKLYSRSIRSIVVWYLALSELLTRLF
jgi:hypothetical protein